MVRVSCNWPLDSTDHVLCFYFVMFGYNLPIKHDASKNTLGHSGGHNERKRRRNSGGGNLAFHLIVIMILKQNRCTALGTALFLLYFLVL